MTETTFNFQKKVTDVACWQSKRCQALCELSILSGYQDSGDLIGTNASYPSQLHRCVLHFVKTLNLKVKSYAENSFVKGVWDWYYVSIFKLSESLKKNVSVVHRGGRVNLCMSWARPIVTVKVEIIGNVSCQENKRLKSRWQHDNGIN